jgi:type VI secretion system secreted protein VgrG
LELNLHHKSLEPVANATYRVEFADGSVKQGTLDDNGHARLESVTAGPVKVHYGEDPTPYTRGAVSTVQGTDDDLDNDLRKSGLDPDQVDLQAIAEHVSGRMIV